MRKFWTLLPLIFCIPSAAAQVLQFADLNTREIDKLDRSKTVLIVPGGILEEHGPYLPSGSDGIFNSQLATDLARLIAESKAELQPSSQAAFRSALVPQMRLVTNTHFLEVAPSYLSRCGTFSWTSAINSEHSIFAGSS